MILAQNYCLGCGGNSRLSNSAAATTLRRLPFMANGKALPIKTAAKKACPSNPAPWRAPPNMTLVAPPTQRRHPPASNPASPFAAKGHPLGRPTQGHRPAGNPILRPGNAIFKGREKLQNYTTEILSLIADVFHQPNRSRIDG